MAFYFSIFQQPEKAVIVLGIFGSYGYGIYILSDHLKKVNKHKFYLFDNISVISVIGWFSYHIAVAIKILNC